jgi:flagellar motor switch protein FliN
MNVISTGSVATDNVQENSNHSVKPIRLQSVDEGGGSGKNLFDGNLSLIEGVKVKLEAIVGGAEITVGELFALKEQSVIKLDSMANAAVEVRLDGKTIAVGRLVVVDDHLGVAIEDIRSMGK